jgi:FMN phosphatase YigB (HAD superfamily)
MIVFLDIGSTLIDGPPSGPAKRLAESLNLEPETHTEIERLLFRASVQDATALAERMSAIFGVDLPAAIGATSSLWDAQLVEAYVLPGAREAIASLKAAGIKRAYLSNIWPPFYARFEKEFPGEVQEQPQFLSFRTGLMKPDCQCFLEALKSVGVRAQEAVMIGDTYENDIRPAMDIGMRTIWVLHRPEKEREWLVRIVNGDAPPPDRTLASIGDLSADLVRRVVHRGDSDEDSAI